MTDICGYIGDRDEALIAYLYDEMETSDHAAFGAHLTTCAACRDDLRALGGVRQQLARWSPPEPSFMIGRAGESAPRSPEPVSGRSWWREVPAWAQVAAALLFLGVSAGIANLDIRRDQNGLTVRTGWSRTSSQPAAAAAIAQPRSTDAAVTRDDLVALERQLRSELRDAQTAMRNVSATDTRSTATGSTSGDADMLRRVRALIDETEKRQERELALRIGEVWRDVTAQRQADLVRIDRSLGVVRNDLGVEVLKQRQSLNYLMRVNQR